MISYEESSNQIENAEDYFDIQQRKRLMFDKIDASILMTSHIDMTNESFKEPTDIYFRRCYLRLYQIYHTYLN